MTSHRVYTSEGQGSGGDSQGDRVPDKNVLYLPPLSLWVGWGAQAEGLRKLPREGCLPCCRA